MITTWRKKLPDNRGYDRWMATLWNVDNGEEIQQFPTDGDFGNLVFSPDSKTILVVTPFKKTELLDAATGNVNRSYE